MQSVSVFIVKLINETYTANAKLVRINQSVNAGKDEEVQRQPCLGLW